MSLDPGGVESIDTFFLLPGGTVSLTHLRIWLAIAILCFPVYILDVPRKSPSKCILRFHSGNWSAAGQPSIFFQ
jgi:hypothetical protein